MDTEPHNPKPPHNPSDHSQIIRWRCPNCGQTLFTFGDQHPPDICAYCKDMTTWKRVSTIQDSSEEDKSDYLDYP